MKRRQFEPQGARRAARASASCAGVARHARDGAARSAPARRSRGGRAPRGRRARTPALATAAGLVSTPQLRNMGTLGGNVCVDTRCNYYNQSYEWRKAIGFCMKKDGDICLVAPGSPRCWAVSSSDTAPVAVEPGRDACALVGAGGERTIPIGALYQRRRHPVPHQAARRDPDRDRCCRPPTAGARPTSSCAAAARSTSRCSAWRRPLRMDGDVVREARIVLGAVASLPREAVEGGAAAGRPAPHAPS